MPKIVTVPDKLLRKKSKTIKALDKKTLKAIEELEYCITSEVKLKGVGLSGVQIGKLVRAFCIYLPPSGDPNDETQKPVLTTCINPQITKTSSKKTLGPKKKPLLEGCLSIPNVWGPIWRHAWIKVKWQDKNLKTRQAKLKDFPARVFQHEYDHLNGILFIDHSIKHRLPLYETVDDKLEEIQMPYKIPHKNLVSDTTE